MSMLTPTSAPQQDKKRWLILISVGLATLLSSLNNSIVNTILPLIGKELHISLGESEWIVLIYLLVLSLLLLPMGRFSDLLGRRRIFLFGFVSFIVASAICGLAPSYGLLVVGRGLLGIAGAMLLSVGPALLTTTFPPEQRGQALGLQALMTYLGLALGPGVGGWLADTLGWHSVFYSAIPVALIALTLALLSIPRQTRGNQAIPAWPNTLSFMVSISALVILLNPGVIHAHKLLFLIAFFILLVIAGGLFVILQRTSTRPLIDLRLFRVRNFRYGNTATILNYLCFFLALFLLPFYMTEVLAFSATQIGLWLTLMPILMMISAPLAGAWSDKIGSRVLASAGMICSTLGLLAFALLGILAPHTMLNRIDLALGLTLSGLGTGLFAAPNNAAILRSAPQAQQGMASGTLATCRYLGMMGGITVGGSLFDAIDLYLSGTGQSFANSFLHAFIIVMGVGALFGILGWIASMMMREPTAQPR